MSEFDVQVSFSKSIFHGNGRGALVTVTDAKTRKVLSRFVKAGTKNQVREAADKLTDELIQELKEHRIPSR